MISKRTKKRYSKVKKSKRNPKERQIYLSNEQIKSQVIDYLNKRVRSFRGEDVFDPFMMAMLTKIKLEIANEELDADDLNTLVISLRMEIDKLEEFVEKLLPPDAINDEWYK